jgi:hypothetical protein
MGLLLAIVALAGQLAAVADALFVAHVTCLADGDRIHVVGDGGSQAASRAATAPSTFTLPSVQSDGHAHAACLLDDDADYVPVAATLAPHVPVREPAPHILLVQAEPRVLRLPLYRLAPKNSPPA